VHLHPFSFEGGTQKLADFGIVIDNQDMVGWGGHVEGVSICIC
jgi:hypothetical protein